MAEVDTLERREDGGRAVALKDQPIRWVQEGEEGGGGEVSGQALMEESGGRQSGQDNIEHRAQRESKQARRPLKVLECST